MAEDIELEIERVSAGYGNIQVLWDLSLRVRRGSIVVLLGPNGAGKSTLIKVIVGLMAGWSGTLTFDGHVLTRGNVRERVLRGMAYMSELGCFRDLSVDENLRIGARRLKRADRKKRIAELYERFPLLHQMRARLGGSLSGGQRKLLGIAKALASRPSLLIMDEPSAGLSPAFVEETIESLVAARELGLTLLIAEQNVRFLSIADTVYVIDAGRTSFEGTPAALENDPALRAAYFGIDA